MNEQRREFLKACGQIVAGAAVGTNTASAASTAVKEPATEFRVKAVAAVSIFNLGEARREGMGTISYEERIKRLKQAGEARSREADGQPSVASSASR